MPYPETGAWWNNARPGEGVFIERQGDIISFTIFSHTPEGQPEFYIAAGPLVPGGFTEPNTFTEGYELNQAYGDLFRIKNGPILNEYRTYRKNDPPSYESDRIGVVRATFHYPNQLVLDIARDAEWTPEGYPEWSRQYYSRFAFGYSQFGADSISVNYQEPRSCWIDLRGKWVFVDESEASSRDAWSFDFTELEASPPPEEMTCPGNFMDHTLVYRDSENDASLTCMRKTGDPSFVPAVRDYNFRCVLRQADGTPLLWFSVYDIGVKQLVATLGPPPNREERPGVLRGPERVLGMRLK